MPAGEAPTALSYQGNIVQPTVATASGSQAAPTAGQVIGTATTTLQPGTYTVSWSAGLVGGTPAAADQNNFGLYLGTVLQATSANAGAVGSYLQPNATVLNISATSGTLAVKAIGAGTAGVTYYTSFNATPGLTTAQDAPLFPYPPLTANGTSVNITSTPANLATTLAGFDLSAQAECVVGRGALVPAGTSDFGFVDTTYLPTQAQILNGAGAGQSWQGPAGLGQFNY